LKYEIRAGAERDMDEAASWYRENTVDPRVPVRFLLEVRAVFETIAESPPTQRIDGVDRPGVLV
jgi:hypothetical protein